MLPRSLADVLWLLNSPSLLQPGRWPDVGDPRLRQAAAGLRQAWALRGESTVAAELAAAIADRPRLYKLGIRAEALLDWGLGQTERFRVIDRQIQLHEAGRSLGELDFLIEDRHTGQLEHWELAVKFFLWGVDGECAWIGPDRKDRLARKLERMLVRQLPLSEGPAFAHWLAATHPPLQGRDWQRRLLSRGWLFLPPGVAFPQEQDLASDHCWRGWWLPLSQRQQAPRPTGTHAWAILPRSLWLSPLRLPRDAEPELIVAPSLETAVNQAASAPPYLTVALDAQGQELRRGFLIRDRPERQ